ncbi:MAG TPA: LLM class F420-dependent oxidoreductase [Candidatus Binataceae bacterium]|jgi:probable F420-dependent oxidoreductase|nr:LLM class F420-dependent oxidoreductase [Candidatus Binataceae bacterium]
MRLGITIPLDGFNNRHLVELVRHAERLGFRDGWSYETFQGDAITPLAAAATVTEHMRLGTAIVSAFTRPPALIALSATGIQNFSGGRFVLGLGLSTPTIVEQWMGIPYQLPVTRLKETVAAIRAAFTGEKVTLQGKTLSINGFRLAAPPDTPPPIYVAAQGEQMLRVAAEIGDGVIVNYITPETFPTRMLPAIREGARRGGRNPDTVDIACRILVAIDPEEHTVREHLRREMTAYVTVPQYNKFFRWLGYEDEARTAFEAWTAGDRKKALTALPDTMMEALYVLGTPDRITQRLRDYEKAGITSTALQFVSYAPDREERRRRILRAMETLAEAWPLRPAESFNEFA